MIPRLRSSLQRLHRDEDGASMVFAAITFFTLAISIMFVFQIGMVSTDRIQIQNAADAAAYSGAVVEANALNAIGQVNDAMTYVHYTLLRYTVDNIVYGTLNEFNRHDVWAKRTRVPQIARLPNPFAMRVATADPRELGLQPPKAPEEIILGPYPGSKANPQFSARWRQVQANEKQRVAAGARWLSDLNDVARMIMKSTPGLVRDRILDVAWRNGATHVAISRDLELAFQTGGAGAGFTDLVADTSGGMASNQDRAAKQSAWRYSLRRLAVDGKPRRFPTWFDPLRGTNSEAYYQIRLCWDKNDWGHPRTPAPGPHFLGDVVGGGGAEAFQGTGIPPNGHWHAKHFHVLVNVENPELQVWYPHGGMNQGQEVACPGGGFGGGHFQDDVPVHTATILPGYIPDPTEMGWGNSDHAVIRCATCWGLVPGGGPWSEVKVNSDQDSQDTHSPADAKSKVGKQASSQFLDLGRMPRPLGITAALLQSGVTVVAWREGTGVGDLLAKAPYGMVAVATAQVGLMGGDDPNGGRVLLLRKLSGTAGRETATFGTKTLDPATGLPKEKPRELQLVESFGGDQTSDPSFPAGQHNYRNLFYSHDYADGIRFGARLVPVARPYSWHPDLQGGKGLAELIGGPGQLREDRWFKTRQGYGGSVAQNEVPDPVRQLHEYLSVSSAQALEEAIWH